MIHPPTYPAVKLNRFTPEALDDPQQTCLCGRAVPLRAALVVWTHPEGTDECAFYEVCSQTCFLRHINGGNA